MNELGSSITNYQNECIVNQHNKKNMYILLVINITVNTKFISSAKSILLNIVGIRYSYALRINLRGGAILK